MKKFAIGIAVFVLLASAIACAESAPESRPAPQPTSVVAAYPAVGYCTIEATVMRTTVIYQVAYGDAAQLFCSLLIKEYVEDVEMRQVYFIPDLPVRCTKYDSEIGLNIEVRSQDAWSGNQVCSELMK